LTTTSTPASYAGIGAASMLALFSIAAGTLLVASSRRRRRTSIATN
jgi:hypothetical protein